MRKKLLRFLAQNARLVRADDRGIEYFLLTDSIPEELTQAAGRTEVSCSTVCQPDGRLAVTVRICGAWLCGWMAEAARYASAPT